MANFIEAVVAALETRIAALGSEAEKLLEEGKAEEAKLQAWLGTELDKLRTEIQQILAGL